MKMSEIWMRKIMELDEIILAVPVGHDGRLMQLFRKREALGTAYARCLEAGR